MSVDRLASKIANSELYQIASDAEGVSPVTVLVEPDLAPTQVRFEPTTTYSGDKTTRHFVEEAPDAIEEQKRRVKETAAFLEHELGERPHWLQSGRVFVVTVTPLQLAAIASSPLVRAIRPSAQWAPKR